MANREAEASLQVGHSKEWARWGAKFAGRCVIAGPFAKKGQFASNLAGTILDGGILDRDRPIYVSALINRQDQPTTNRQVIAEADLVADALRRLGPSDAHIILTHPLPHSLERPFNPLAILEEYRDESDVPPAKAFELGHVGVVSRRSIASITGKIDDFQARALIKRPTGNGYEWQFLF